MSGSFATVRLVVGVVYTNVYTADLKVHYLLQDLLYRKSLKVLEAEYNLQADLTALGIQSYGMEGRSFYIIRDGKSSGYFYSGFLQEVLECFKQRAVSYTIEYQHAEHLSVYLQKIDTLRQDLEADASKFEQWLPGFELRDYQQYSILQILRYRYGYVQLATGAGKTRIAAAFLKLWQDRMLCGLTPLPALFVVNTRYLVEQTIAAFKSLGLRYVEEYQHSFLNQELHKPYIFVTTIQKLYSKSLGDAKRKKFLKQIGVLFLDECHHQSADTWKQLVRSCDQLVVRVGLTATPFKTLEGLSIDDGYVQGLLGRPLVYLPYFYLRDRGFLADLRVKVLTIDRVELLAGVEYKPSSGWLEDYRRGVVYNRFVYDALKQIVVEQKDKRTLILTYLVEHASTVHDFLSNCSAVDQPCYLITSKSKGEEISFYNKLDSYILVTTTVFDEGVDLPELDVVIMLTGMKSIIKTIQRAGRGSRKTVDKDYTIVYDFDFTFNRVLHQHFLKRLQVYEQERLNLITT